MIFPDPVMKSSMNDGCIKRLMCDICDVFINGEFFFQYVYLSMKHALYFEQ